MVGILQKSGHSSPRMIDLRRAADFFGSATSLRDHWAKWPFHGFSFFSPDLCQPSWNYRPRKSEVSDWSFFSGHYSPYSVPSSFIDLIDLCLKYTSRYETIFRFRMKLCQLCFDLSTCSFCYKFIDPFLWPTSTGQNVFPVGVTNMVTSSGAWKA